ncbi:MAG: ANTAR domain-containing protein [Lachnospiraceae bacterium]|nr:ANTAR domain-containing protein [Lachnospiraceae bacterium]
MSLEQKVYSVLFVSSAPSLTASFSALLPSSEYYPVHKVKSIAAAGRSFSARSYDFVIIDSPLPDDTGINFAIDAGGDGSTVVLLIVRSDIQDEIFDKVAGRGVFTLAKPLSSQIVDSSLRWMQVVKERLRKTELKTQSLEEKMNEIRLINRAKWILIKELKMDEPQAHRYIEKQAMDRCVSRREVAETLIKTYSYH